MILSLLYPCCVMCSALNTLPYGIKGFRLTLDSVTTGKLLWSLSFFWELFFSLYAHLNCDQIFMTSFIILWNLSDSCKDKSLAASVWQCSAASASLEACRKFSYLIWLFYVLNIKWNVQKVKPTSNSGWNNSTNTSSIVQRSEKIIWVLLY